MDTNPFGPRRPPGDPHEFFNQTRDGNKGAEAGLLLWLLWALTRYAQKEFHTLGYRDPEEIQSFIEERVATHVLTRMPCERLSRFTGFGALCNWYKPFVLGRIQRFVKRYYPQRTCSLWVVDQDGAEVLIEVEDANAMSPAEVAERAETLQLVGRLLGELRPDEQEVIKQKCFNAKGLDEIACHLSLLWDRTVTKNAVRSLLYRALDNLRRLWHDRHGQEL